jgi:hypothetical protein
MNESNNITTLLNARKNEYGQAWLDSGRVIGLLSEDFVAFVEAQPYYVHNWVLILSKLIRILHSPNNPDHWRDIAGYATLVLNHITEDVVKL